jgi:hypothetical protein
LHENDPELVSNAASVSAHHRLFRFSAILLGTLCSLGSPAQAAGRRFDLPRALLGGYTRTFKLDVALRVHLAVELEPKDETLDTTAAAVADPSSPMHRMTLSPQAFAARYGRPQGDVDALIAWLRRNGASGIYASRNRLVVGGDLTVPQAQTALQTTYDLWQNGNRTVVAPTSALTLPVSGVRAVRGAIKAYTPRLAVDRPGLPTDLRGSWYTPAQFRAAYDAIPDGGAGTRIALIEDASDEVRLADLGPFAAVEGSTVPGEPPDALATGDDPIKLDPGRVIEKHLAEAIGEEVCGRDDRGQEPTMDVDAALTLAPLAAIDVRYDEVCVRGGEGVLEIQRALDDDPAPDVIVFPFASRRSTDPAADAFGTDADPALEAMLRGIPVVVPAGDDGAYGYRVAGVEQPAGHVPLRALPVVICAGGTQLGERTGPLTKDRGTTERTRPAAASHWIRARAGRIAAPTSSRSNSGVNQRMVPDVSADASGHLESSGTATRTGGVGGTSECAASSRRRSRRSTARSRRPTASYRPAICTSSRGRIPTHSAHVDANDRGYARQHAAPEAPAAAARLPRRPSVAAAADRSGADPTCSPRMRRADRGELQRGDRQSP